MDGYELIDIEDTAAARVSGGVITVDEVWEVPVLD